MDRRWFLVALLCFSFSACGSDEASPPPTQTANKITHPETPYVISKAVFIGDSITAFWPLEKDFSDAVNAGIIRQVSSQMLERFEQDVLSYHPTYVVILAGTNDTMRVQNPNTDNIAEMASRASAAGSIVVLCTIPPIERWSAGLTITDPIEGNVAVDRFNQSIWDLSRAYGYPVADYHSAMILPNGAANSALFDDGLHPNDDGYAIMTAVIAPLLH